jgi:hypothetical protein
MILGQHNKPPETAAKKEKEISAKKKPFYPVYD